MAEPYIDRDAAARAAEHLRAEAEADQLLGVLEGQRRVLLAKVAAEEAAARTAATKAPAPTVATPAKVEPPTPAAPKVTTSPHRPPGGAHGVPPAPRPRVEPAPAPAPVAPTPEPPRAAPPAPEFITRADSDEARAARPLFKHGQEVFLVAQDGSVRTEPVTVVSANVARDGSVDYFIDGFIDLQGQLVSEEYIISSTEAVRYFSRRPPAPAAPATPPPPRGPGLTRGAHDPDAHPAAPPPPPGARKGMWGAFKDLLSESLQTTRDLAAGGASAGTKFIKGVWETLKSTPKVIFSRQLWETVGGAAGSILGVRSPVVIYKFIKDRYRMSAEKSELATLIKDGIENYIAANRLDPTSREAESAGSALMVRAERVKMRIDAHPKMSAELKRKTKARVDTVIREHAGQSTFHQEKFNDDINKILDDFVEARVSGYDVAKEVLNTGFVLTGLMTFRGISYATLAAAERANKFSRNYEREHRDELTSGWAKAAAEGATLKDLVWGSLKETGRILTGRAAKAEDDEDTTQLKRDRFRALGNILRFAGISVTTYADPEHLSLSIDKALDAMQKQGVAGALVNNFEENAVRMVNALKSLPDLPSNVENWVEKNLHIGHGSVPDAAAAAAAPGVVGGALPRGGAGTSAIAAGDPGHGGAPGVTNSAPLPRPGVDATPIKPPAPSLGAPGATGPKIPVPEAPHVGATGSGSNELLDSIHATLKGKDLIIPLENGGDDLYGKLRALIMDSLDKDALAGGRLTSLSAGRFLNVEENIISKLLHGHSAGGVSAKTFDDLVGLEGDNLVIHDYAAFKSKVLSTLWANATKTVTEAATESGDSTAVGYVDSVSQKQWQHLVDLKTGSGVVVDDFSHDKLVHDAEAHDTAARSPFVKEVRDSGATTTIKSAPVTGGSGRMSQADVDTVRTDALEDAAVTKRINSARSGGAGKDLGAVVDGGGKMTPAEVAQVRKDIADTDALVKRSQAARAGGAGVPSGSERGMPGASSGAPLPRVGDTASALVDKAVTAADLKKLAKVTETFVSGDTSTTDALYSETLGWQEKLKKITTALKDRSEDAWYKYSNDNGPVSFMKHGDTIIMKNSGLDGGTPVILNEKTIGDSMKFKEAVDSTV